MASPHTLSFDRILVAVVFAAWLLAFTFMAVVYIMTILINRDHFQV